MRGDPESGEDESPKSFDHCAEGKVQSAGPNLDRNEVELWEMTMQTNVPNGSQKSHTLLIVLFAALGGCALLCCGVGGALLPPAIQAAREARARQRAAENLRQIGQALHNYHQTHSGQIPAEGTTEPPQDTASHENTMLHPEFPVVEGTLQVTKRWSLTLPEKFNRRLEKGSLVIWRPGFTMWISALNNDNNESKEDRLKWLRERMSADAFDVEEISDEDVLRLAYRLHEESEDQRVAAFYTFAIGSSGHIQLAICFDDEDETELVRKIWLSVKEEPTASSLLPGQGFPSNEE